MDKYEFKATNLIVEKFEKNDITYFVVNKYGREAVCVNFPVNNGPNLLAQFFCIDDSNSVAVHIEIVTSIQPEKRMRVMEACNILNCKVRYAKFYVDADGDINCEYDFPEKISDECIAEIALEILIRSMHIMNGEYQIFMKALYTNESLQEIGKNRERISEEELEELEEIRRKIMALLDQEEDEEDWDTESRMDSFSPLISREIEMESDEEDPESVE